MTTTSTMLGASLEDLEALAGDYRTTGATLLARSQDLAAKIRTTIDAFTQTLDQLKQKSTSLTEAIEGELTNLNGQANAVAWTGANRHAFDSDMSSFAATMRSGTQTIRQETDFVRTQVDTHLSASLDAFSTTVTQQLEAAKQATDSTSSTIVSQQQLLAQVANSGWQSN